MTDQTDYSDRGFVRRFMAKEQPDELERAMIDSTVNQEAEKLAKQYASDPDFFKRVTLKLAQKVLQE